MIHISSLTDTGLKFHLYNSIQVCDLEVNGIDLEIFKTNSIVPVFLPIDLLKTQFGYFDNIM